MFGNNFKEDYYALPSLIIPNTLATFNFFLLYWNIIEFFFFFNRCLPYPSICQYFISEFSLLIYFYTISLYMFLLFLKTFFYFKYSVSLHLKSILHQWYLLREFCSKIWCLSIHIVNILFRYSTCSSILIYVTSKL